jgi:hypothetical protein
MENNSVGFIQCIHLQIPSRYSYEQSWNPLYSAERVRLPQFYRSMMTALPRPYQTETEGVPYSFDSPTQFVDSEGKEPIRALPTFHYPRTQRHEDGRFDILLPFQWQNTSRYNYDL